MKAKIQNFGTLSLETVRILYDREPKMDLYRGVK